MAVQCILVGKGKDDVFTAVYGETTFDKVLKAYNENKVVQVIYQNRIYYLDNTTVVDSPEAFSFISAFSNQNDETGEIKHYVISLMTGDNWSGPFLQNSTPATHANTHAKDGTDPLAPADIGAMELSENILKQSNEDITSQVAQALSKNLVPFSGGTMTGLLNVLTPVGDSNATTKKYVDDALSEKIGMDGIGDLHVWKKMVVTKDPIPEVPGSYKLGPSEQLIVAARIFANSRYESYIEGVLASNTISVNLNGVVSLANPTTVKLLNFGTDGITYLDGRQAISDYSYFMIPSESYTAVGCNINMPTDTIYYIPASSTYYRSQSNQGSTSSFNAAQLVTGVSGTPAIPAGITTTYPVSTNPNAYQEGNDAKPAGYTLGKVMTGKFSLGAMYASDGHIIKYANSITVSDNGTVALSNESSFTVGSGGYTQSQIQTACAGKFIQYYRTSSGSIYPPDSIYPFNSTPSAIVFVPSDVSIVTKVYDDYNCYAIDRYQPVTGYAAIPAGTTIEYLGKLGDKTRVQVVSYVGTGTYGADNPCSITADFPIKVAISLYHYISGSIFMISDELGVDYTPDKGFDNNNANYSFGKKSHDGKTLTWYSTRGQDAQFNNSGYTYYFLAIG